MVLVDRNSGRQIQLLGQLRRKAQATCFALATAENGFLSPVSDDIRAAIGSLDGASPGPDISEDDLARQISVWLGLPGDMNTERGASDGDADDGNGSQDDESSELL